MKKKIQRMTAAAAALLIIPYIITVLINGKYIKVSGNTSPQYVKVQVGNSQKKVPWMDYFVGILAKEIDISYGEEALKAQAVLTRTNLYRQVGEKKDVTLSGEYMTYTDMEKMWGKKEAKKIYERLEKAVEKTGEKVILYDGKLAAASFHQLSNGKTRNGNEVLGREEYPYLQPKECLQDVEAKQQLQTLTLTYDEAKEYCRPFLVAVDKKESGKKFTFQDFEIKETDSAGYVTKIRIGNDVYSGEEFRTALGLPSSCFTLQDQEGSLKITTKGVGHGLGMSQYTANEMAKEGKTCDEILQYFFEGAEIKEVAEILLNIE